MAEYFGTDGSDSIVGTDGDDIFHWSLGSDTYSGGAGYDKLIIDYSGITGSLFFPAHNVASMNGEMWVAFRSMDHNTSVQTYGGVEEIDFKAGPVGDVFYLDFTDIRSVWKLTLDGGDGFDSVQIRLANSAAPLVGTIVGGSLTSGALTLRNIEQFYLYLGGGNDQVTLAAGNDTVEANGGDDMIDGGAGDDQIDGGWGGDTLIGGDGNDRLFANDDYAFVDEGTEHDSISGGAGNDEISIGYGDDADGGSGTDILTITFRGSPTGLNLDFSTLFAGGSMVVGGGTITGFESYGAIYASEFADTINTGNAPRGGNIGLTGIFGFGGNDTITTGSLADQVNGGDGNDVIHSGNGDDRVSGDGGDDQVYAEAGNDTLWGGDGRDFLDGGTGADRMEGGDGDDTYVVDNVGDVVIEQYQGVGGIDLVQSSITFILPSYLDRLTLTGTAAINGTGNNLDNVIIGNGADNILDPGNSGVDQIDGGDGIDTLSFASSFTGVSFSLGIATAQTVFGGSVTVTNVENLTGSSAGDSLTGSAIANVIRGAGGSDQIRAGLGNDIVFGDAGDDILSGEGGQDTLTGGAGNDTFKDSAAGLDGDTITDLALGEKIYITDANLASFSFELVGNTLNYSGGSLTLGSPPAGRLVATAFASGGVMLTMTAINYYNDINNDRRSDIIVRDPVSGWLTDWLGAADGSLASNSANVSIQFPTDWKVAGSGDYNGDGRDDMLLRSDAGWLTNWLGTSTGGLSNNGANTSLFFAPEWKVAGNGDFNNDGKADLLLRRDDGWLTNWLGTASGSFTNNGANASLFFATDWKVASTGDFNGDGYTDILLRRDDGWVTNWLGTANGGFTNNGANTSLFFANEWKVIGTGDINGDGKDDLILRRDDGWITDWLGTDSGSFTNNGANTALFLTTDWKISSIADFNGDGREDLLLRNDSGWMTDWLGTATGSFINNGVNFSTFIAPNWVVQDPFM